METIFSKSLKKKKTDTTTAEEKQQQFIQSYKPDYSFANKLDTDLKFFFSNLYRIPSAIANMGQRGMIETGYGYNQSKPFWQQGQGYNVFTNPQSRQQYLDVTKKNLLNIIPGYKLFETLTSLPYMENIPGLAKLPKTSASRMVNDLFLNSIVKGTGKFVYDPQSKGRKWLPKPSEGTRYQDYKERPFTTALEDITNLALMGAPIFKASGLGAKIAATPASKFLKASKIGQATIETAEGLGKAKSYIPNKLMQGVSNQLAKFQAMAEFKKAMTEFNRNSFLGKENILQPGYDKLIKMGADLPLDAQKHLFGVLEGSQLYDERIISQSYQAAKAAGTIDIPYSTFKNNFDTAFDYIGKKSIKESNYFVKRGIFTPEEVGKRAWMPAVKNYLIKTGKYTIDELEDILVKENGFAKSLSDEFDIAVAEMEKLGYRKPVYMPHQFEKYLSNADYFKQQPLYKKTPGFLKKTSGVSGYIEEPFTVWTRHELQVLKYQLTERFVNKIVDKFGLALADGEKAAFGYKPYYPEGYIKNMFTKNPKLKVNTQIQLPESIANEMNRVFNSPGELEKLLRVTYDPITKLWKTSVLALSPRWLFNNFVGNMALNLVGGVFDPMAYINSFRKLNQARILQKKLGISTNKAMAKLGIRSGVADTGLYAAEMRGAAAGFSRVAETSPIQNMFGKALNYTLFPQIVKGMYRVNRTIENFYRTAHYLDKIGKGMSPSQALASVNEFLFDYSALTSIEKSFARRVLPFYAWQKNITRLVVSMPIKHPLTTAIIQKLENLVSEDEKAKDIRDGLLPEYMSDYIKTQFSDDGQNLYLSTRGMNPFADVGIATGNFLSYLSALNPMLKIPLERIIKMNLFKGREFSSPYSSYGSNDYESRQLPSLGRHILSNIPQAKLIEDLIRRYARYDTGEPILTKEGTPKYDKNWFLTLLKQFGINLTPYNLEEMKKQQIKELMGANTQKENYQEKLNRFKQNK